MCKWFFFPSGENFLFTEWNWMKETFSGFFYFFSGEFLHCMKLREKKSSQFEKFRNKREKNVFLQNIFFLNLWNWCYEWNQSETCFISCLKQKENIFKKHFKCENNFFPSVFTFYLPNGTFWIEQHVEWDFSSVYQLSHYDPYRRYHTQSFSFCTRAEPKQTHTCCSGAFLGGDLGDMPQVYVNTANTFS